MSAFGFCKCGQPRTNGTNAKCNPCSRLYQKALRRLKPSYHRPKPPAASLAPDVLERRRARDCARKAKQRGTLTAQRCQRCGGPAAQMHHSDYTRPLDVKWLCPDCHAAWHLHWRELVENAFDNWVDQPPQAFVCGPVSQVAS